MEASAGRSYRFRPNTARVRSIPMNPDPASDEGDNENEPMFPKSPNRQQYVAAYTKSCLEQMGGSYERTKPGASKCEVPKISSHDAHVHILGKEFTHELSTTTFLY